MNSYKKYINHQKIYSLKSSNIDTDQSNNSISSSERRNTIIKQPNIEIPTNDNDEKLQKNSTIINTINNTLNFFDKLNTTKKNIKEYYFPLTKNNNSNLNKYKDKIKNNQKLKERNIYLNNILKELQNENIQTEANGNPYNQLIISGSINSNSNQSSITNSYNYLLKQKNELLKENKKLKEEYKILKLSETNSICNERIFENKDEIEAKIKSLNYSLNNFMELLSTSINSRTTPSFKTMSKSNNNYKENDLFFEKSKNDTSSRNAINQKSFYDMDYNVVFTESGNLNTNNNNYYEEQTSSNDEDKIEIPLKPYEKTAYNYKNHLFKEKFGNLSSFTQKQNKNALPFSESRKIITNSFTKSLEYPNNDKQNKVNKNDVKNIYSNKNNINHNYNCCSFKNILSGEKKNNLLYPENNVGNKSDKFLVMKNMRTSSNLKHDKNSNLKSSENKKIRAHNNYKTNGGISQKFNKIFKKSFK